MNILAIDADPSILELLAALLSDLGRVQTCSSSLKGLDLAARGLPDLILCDAQMPRLSGIEVCKRLRQDSLTREIPVLCLSGGAGEEQELAALSAGAVDFIKKPINPLILRARVKTQIELLKKSALLLDMARRDPLTGMFNRRYFDERAREEWERHASAGLPMALAMMDVDHFKALNDSQGHARGDECLIAVADCSRGCAQGPGQLAARYGGEEFVFMLPGAGAAEASAFGAKLCQAVKALGLAHAKSPLGVVTASVGVAWTPDLAGREPLDLLRLADKALYQAKRGGRDRFAIAEGWEPAPSAPRRR